MIIATDRDSRGRRHSGHADQAPRGSSPKDIQSIPEIGLCRAQLSASRSSLFGLLVGPRTLFTSFLLSWRLIFHTTFFPAKPRCPSGELNGIHAPNRPSPMVMLSAAVSLLAAGALAFGRAVQGITSFRLMTYGTEFWKGALFHRPADKPDPRGVSPRAVVGSKLSPFVANADRPRDRPGSSTYARPKTPRRLGRGYTRILYRFLLNKMVFRRAL